MFPKDKVAPVNEKVTEFLGSKPVESPIRKCEQTDSDIFHNWRVASLNPAFAAVLKATETPAPGWGGSMDHFQKYISSISAEGIVSSDLPFYLLVLRVGLNSSALAASVNLEKDLQRIRAPIRVFLESLDGYSRKGAYGVLSSPCPSFSASGPIRSSSQRFN